MWHKTKLNLQLSLYFVTTINWYENVGYAERNKFIEDSIKNHLDYLTTGPGDDSTSPTVEIEVQISTLLALKLWWVALINKISVSAVVNEALAFSIPVLLEKNQELEDFRLEVELDE